MKRFSEEGFREKFNLDSKQSQQQQEIRRIKISPQFFIFRFTLAIGLFAYTN